MYTYCQTLVVVALVLSPVVATTTLPDPGLLLAGQTAVLTCSVDDGVSVSWFYGDETVSLLLLPNQTPITPMVVGDVEFTPTLSQNITHLISHLSFTASPDMDGGDLECVGILSSGAFSSDKTTLQVETTLSVTLVVACSVVVFIAGVLFGLFVGICTCYCCRGRTRSRKPHPPPPSAHYYDDTPPETQLDLKAKEAYGKKCETSV